MATLFAQTKLKTSGNVGKINTKTYTYAEYNQLLNNYFNFWQQRDGKKLTSDRKKTLNDQCWEELIGRAIYDSEIKRRNLTITDVEAYNSVIKNPPQQVKTIESLKTNGKFDMEKFKKAMEVDAKFKGQVLSLVKETMVYDKLFAVIKSQVKVKPDSIKGVWLKDNNLVSAKVIVFDFNKIKEITVADSEALRYYDNNKEKFKKDPARKYKYVKFSQDMYADQSKAKAKADSIYQVIKAGGDFAALATALSDDPGSGKQGGELGWFTRDRMVKPFADAAFSQEVNAVSLPVKSQFGWHIIQTEEKRTNEQGQEEVRARHILVKSQPEEAISQLLNADANQFLTDAKEKGIVKAAELKKYPVLETKEFYASSKSIPEYQGGAELVAASFSNPVGFIPANYTGRNGDIFVSEVSDSMGVHYSPFDAEKTGIVRTVEREKKIAANKAFARNFYNSHTAENYLTAAAADSLKIVEANDIKEGGSLPEIGAVKALSDSLLASTEGKYTSLIETDTNDYLALVTKRSKPVLANWEKQKTKLIAKANDDMKTQHLNNWYYAQRQKMKIEDNRKDFYELNKPQSNMQQIQLN
jgi:peptidyl-prolyl cis-trans isomerase D